MYAVTISRNWKNLSTVILGEQYDFRYTAIRDDHGIWNINVDCFIEPLQINWPNTKVLQVCTGLEDGNNYIFGYELADSPDPSVRKAQRKFIFLLIQYLIGKIEDPFWPFNF